MSTPFECNIYRFRKVPVAPEPMTRRAWEAPTLTGLSQRASYWIHISYETLYLYMALTISTLEHSFVQLAWIGPILSKWVMQTHSVFHNRTRVELIKRQIQVAGDQWPTFLYANYTYDAKDSCNGLLCSGLLISASISRSSNWPCALTQIMIVL